MTEIRRDVEPKERPQVRPRLKLTEREVRQLSDEASMSRSTIQRWAKGEDPCEERTEKDLRLAMRKLGIPRRVVKAADVQDAELRESRTVKRALPHDPLSEPIPQSA